MDLAGQPATFLENAGLSLGIRELMAGRLKRLDEVLPLGALLGDRADPLRHGEDEGDRDEVTEQAGDRRPELPGGLGEVRQREGDRRARSSDRHDPAAVAKQEEDLREERELQKLEQRRHLEQDAEASRQPHDVG